MRDDAANAGMALLERLRDEGGERFDAAGWHYLDTLARRAASHEGSARRLLDAKIAAAATAFAERFAQARSAAAALMESACKTHPQAAEAIQRLHASADFQGLRRLCATLDAHAQCAPLRALAVQLEPGAAPAQDQANARSAVNAPATSTPATLELKTVRESRATWARLSVDKQLALAMKQAPQNAGPINSHMLVLRALAKMQSISPDYLNRVVSYVDTLLGLDPGDIAVAVKKKKPVAAKVAKPLKTGKK